MKTLSQEEINQLKKQHGAIFQYNSTDGKMAIFKSPDFQILDACKSVCGKNGMKFNKMLVENCWIQGDEELKTNEEYLLGIFDWISGIIKKKEGILTEL